jgi:hypothetical protein
MADFNVALQPGEMPQREAQECSHRLQAFQRVSLRVSMATGPTPAPADGAYWAGLVNSGCCPIEGAPNYN